MADGLCSSFQGSGLIGAVRRYGKSGWTQVRRSLGCRWWRRVARYFDGLLDSRTVIKRWRYCEEIQVGNVCLAYQSRYHYN